VPSELDDWAAEHEERKQRESWGKWWLGKGLDKQTIQELLKNGFVDAGQIPLGPVGASTQAPKAEGAARKAKAQQDR
jgi:ribosomal protein L12E/L44/L45/RPP1/RPP2